jgi:hypothetical protein
VVCKSTFVVGFIAVKHRSNLHGRVWEHGFAVLNVLRTVGAAVERLAYSNSSILMCCNRFTASVALGVVAVVEAATLISVESFLEDRTYSTWLELRV